MLASSSQGLLAGAQEKKEVPAGTAVTITVKQAEPEKPSITLKLDGRQAKALPVRCGCASTGGGNIDVTQPGPDTFIITVTGVGVANGHPLLKSTGAFHIDVNQLFEVSFEKPAGDIKNPKITLEGRVIGLLRSHCKGGCATESAQAAIASAHGGDALTISLPANSTCKGENLSINDHEGPCSAPVLPGKYVLHAQFEVSATHPIGLWKPASSEFAPDPALDPLWIDHHEPFHGAAKKDFGFQIIVKVLEESDPWGGKEEVKENGDKKANGDKKPSIPEKLPPPKP